MEHKRYRGSDRRIARLKRQHQSFLAKKDFPSMTRPLDKATMENQHFYEAAIDGQLPDNECGGFKQGLSLQAKAALRKKA